MLLLRSLMIFASSSGDHFGCFLAGDSDGWAWALDTLFAGMNDDAATELVEWFAFSLLGFSNSEIFRVADIERGNCWPLWWRQLSWSSGLFVGALLGVLIEDLGTACFGNWNVVNFSCARRCETSIHVFKRGDWRYGWLTELLFLTVMSHQRTIRDDNGRWSGFPFPHIWVGFWVSR